MTNEERNLQQEMFLFSKTLRTASGTRSSSLSMGTVSSLFRLMRSEHETDHSSQFNSKFQNKWSCRCIPPVQNHGARGQSYTYCAYGHHQIKPDRFCKQLFTISSPCTIANYPGSIIYFIPLDRQLNTKNLDVPHYFILPTPCLLGWKKF